MGSSRTTSGASRTKARASAIRRRSPAESGRPPSPTTRLVALRQRAHEASAPASTAASTTRASSASASPSRMFSATVPRSSDGRCGTQASCRRQAAVSHSARSTPATVMRPPVGSASRSSRRPACSCPRRSGRRARPSRPARARSRRSRARAPARVGERDAFEPARHLARRDEAAGRHRRRGVEQVEQPRRDRHAVGARVELRAQPPQRQIQLGREDQNGQCRLEREAAAREPHADGHRDERDAERGRQLEHRAGQEGDPQRAHRRPPVPLADLRDRRRLRLAAVERAQRRQAAHDVEEVRREQPQRLPALARPLLGVAADQPHEDRHERQRQQHHPRRLQVDRGDPAEHRERDDAAEHELRQIAREVRLERVHALHGRRRQLAGLRPVERGGLRRAAACRRPRAGARTASSPPPAGPPLRTPTRGRRAPRTRPRAPRAAP